MSMNLGILVNTDRHLQHVLGLTEAAAVKGHSVELFVMDDGIRLLTDDRIRALAEREGVSMSYCAHSASAQGASLEGISEAITSGSQLNNAMMNNAADRVIVL